MGQIPYWIEAYTQTRGINILPVSVNFREGQKCMAMVNITI